MCIIGVNNAQIGILTEEKASTKVLPWGVNGNIDWGRK